MEGIFAGDLELAKGNSGDVGVFSGIEGGRAEGAEGFEVDGCGGGNEVWLGEVFCGRHGFLPMVALGAGFRPDRDVPPGLACESNSWG